MQFFLKSVYEKSLFKDNVTHWGLVYMTHNM